MQGRFRSLSHHPFYLFHCLQHLWYSSRRLNQIHYFSRNVVHLIIFWFWKHRQGVNKTGGNSILIKLRVLYDGMAGWRRNEWYPEPSINIECDQAFNPTRHSESLISFLRFVILSVWSDWMFIPGTDPKVSPFLSNSHQIWNTKVFVCYSSNSYLYSVLHIFWWFLLSTDDGFIFEKIHAY